MRLPLRTFVYVMIAATLVMTAVGCSKRQPMEFGMTVQEPSMTKETMRSIILQADDRSRWVLTPKEDGLIEGVLDTRGHRIEVAITYDASGYRIRFTGGQDRETGETIFYKRYNTWIKKLDQEIRRSYQINTRPKV